MHPLITIGAVGVGVAWAFFRRRRIVRHEEWHREHQPRDLCDLPRLDSDVESRKVFARAAVRDRPKSRTVMSLDSWGVGPTDSPPGGRLRRDGAAAGAARAWNGTTEPGAPVARAAPAATGVTCPGCGGRIVSWNPTTLRCEACGSLFRRPTSRPSRPSSSGTRPTWKSGLVDAYYVYENYPTNRATVHAANCRFCNDGRGRKDQPVTSNGMWHGPFSTTSTAEEAAKGTGRSWSLHGCV